MNWVRIQKLADLTGLTEHAIRNYRKKGIWRDGVHIRKVGGTLWFNLRAIEAWVEGKAS